MGKVIVALLVVVLVLLCAVIWVVMNDMDVALTELPAVLFGKTGEASFAPLATSAPMPAAPSLPSDAPEPAPEPTVTPEPTAAPAPTATPVPTPDPDKPMVALTFDDGPGGYTDWLLDVLEENDVKATFFMLGSSIGYWEDTVCRAVEDGHEIASHTWDHPNLNSLSYEEISNEISDTRALIYEVTGVDTMLMRPPYGNSDSRVVAMAEEEGVALIKWSVDTMDWSVLDAYAVYEHIMSHASDGAIILCHDVHRTTIEAMEMAIPALLEEGYQLVTITELLTCRGGTVEAGVTYHSQDEFY